MDGHLSSPGAPGSCYPPKRHIIGARGTPRLAKGGSAGGTSGDGIGTQKSLGRQFFADSIIFTQAATTSAVPNILVNDKHYLSFCLETNCQSCSGVISISDDLQFLSFTCTVVSIFHFRKKTWSTNPSPKLTLILA